MSIIECVETGATFWIWKTKDNYLYLQKMLHICYIECYIGIERYVRWIP